MNVNEITSRDKIYRNLCVFQSVLLSNCQLYYGDNNLELHENICKALKIGEHANEIIRFSPLKYIAYECNFVYSTSILYFCVRYITRYTMTFFIKLIFLMVFNDFKKADHS